MRAEPPRQRDLTEWDVAELQPDSPPVADVVTPLRLAVESGGLWYRDYDTRAFTPTELITHKTNAVIELNRHYEKQVRSQANAWYPEFEQLTWPQQESDARAWADDNAYVTVYLDQLLPDPSLGQQEYDDAKSALATRIVTLADQYRGLALSMTKLLKEHRADIWDATTRAEIDTILATGMSI
jgi:hypothetical protein